MKGALGPLTALTLALGCAFDPIAPAEASIGCSTSRDCPPERFCFEGLCASVSASCLRLQGDELEPVADGSPCALARDGAAGAAEGDGAEGDGICVRGACAPSSCGDGVRDDVEECDDANDIDGDGCDSTCTTSRCGNGVRAPPEECDDGNDIDADACTNGCLSSRCGDAVTQGTEECDDGNTLLQDFCLPDCTFNECGDGIIDLFEEECDDGNLDDEDRCLSGCTTNVCGDAVHDQLEEECDDGNVDDEDGCLTGCIANVCGDGIFNPLEEECDDGDDDEEDGCLTGCIENICGDGLVNLGVEECDDGNLDDEDRCLANCVENVCGDAIHDRIEEECDDGDGGEDACLASCLENECGDGIVNLGVEPCDDGNVVLDDGCLPGCALDFCGNGVRFPAAEDCDDGNTQSRDGCAADCSLTVWRSSVGALGPTTAPIAWDTVGGPVIGVATIGGDIVALDALSGDELWRVVTGGSFSAPLSEGPDGIYGVTDDGTVYGVDRLGPVDGGPRWTRSLDQPASGAGLALVRTEEGGGKDLIVAVDALAKLYAIDGASGALRTFDVNGATYAHSVDSRTYDATAACDGCTATTMIGGGGLGGDKDEMGVLVPLGDELWLYNFDANCPPSHVPLGAPIVGQLVFRGGGLGSNTDVKPVYAMLADGNLVRITGDNTGTCAPTIGSNVSFSFTPPASMPVAVDDPFGQSDMLVIGDATGAVTAVRAEANVLGGFELKPLPGDPFVAAAAVRVPPAIATSLTMFIVDEDGNVHAVSILSSEELWHVTLGAAPAGGPLVAFGQVYVGTQAGDVVALERGEEAAPDTWWSRQGANASGSGHSSSCSSTSGGSLMAVLLLALRSRRRRG